MIVKVQISDNPAVGAIITSQDKKLHMNVSEGHVDRRLNGKKIGFFRADFDEKTGMLELGDRVPDENW